MISVIIAVYNGEKTIQQTVASVLNQTHADLELIVVDDGSTDATLDVLSEIHDPRLKVFTYANSGVSANRNRGLTLAKFEYVAFIDADDLWAPIKLELQLKALEEHPEAAVAYCWVDYINADGRCLFKDGRETTNGNVYEKMLAHCFIDSGSNILVRKSAIEQVGTFDESLSCVEDWDLYLKLAARYPFVCVPLPLVFYRLHPNSLTTKVLMMERCFLRVVDRAFSDAPATLQHLKPKSTARAYEYLMGKSTQGFPSRRKSLIAFRFYAKALRNYPAILWRPRPKLWVLKALIKAMLGILKLDRWFLWRQISRETQRGMKGNLNDELDSSLVHSEK